MMGSLSTVVVVPSVPTLDLTTVPLITLLPEVRLPRVALRGDLGEWARRGEPGERSVAAWGFRL